MNNKAFTLVELIAIISILAIICLITFPSLLSATESNKEKQYNNMVENLCLAGESYIYADGSFDLSSGSEFFVTIQQLINYGNVDAKTKNPLTNNLISGDKLSYEVLNNGSFDCNYVDE